VAAPPKPKEPQKADKTTEIVDAGGKHVGEGAPGGPSPVVGRPRERAQFPAWTAQVWDPEFRSAATTTRPLELLTVGRVGDEPAAFASLSEALAALPEEGGVIHLRGRGPFLLPAQRIADRGHVVITGTEPVPSGSDGAVSPTPKAGAASGTSRSGPPKATLPAPSEVRAAAPAVAAATDPADASKSVGKTGPVSPARGAGIASVASAREVEQPVIVLVPGAGPGSESGLLLTGSSLTLYGVHLTVIADTFAGENPLRLVDVRSGDLSVRRSSVTMSGRRRGPTVAFALSSESARAPRVLFDRVLFRGADLSALEADVGTLDFLAINSLFVTGKSPPVSLMSGTGGVPSGEASPDAARRLRFFSCTSCTEESALDLRPNRNLPAQPVTRFHVMNSIFGVVYRPQGAAAMIALNDWPILTTGAERSAPVQNVKWQTESFVVRGWKALVGGDGRAQFGNSDGGAWGRFWGEPRSAFYYQPTHFPSVDPSVPIDLAAFKPESFTSLPNASGDSGPPGCDVGLLTAAGQPLLDRAAAFAREPSVPPKWQSDSSDAPVQLINLDDPKLRWRDLARFINLTQWPSGTRFRVHGGGGRKPRECSPIRVTNKSLTIEFVDESPALLVFRPDERGENAGGACISVSGGTIEIVNANFRIEPSIKKSSIHWLLDVKNGSFALRKCRIQGQLLDSPGYEGLVRFQASGAAAADPAGGVSGLIRDSYLITRGTALSGDLVGPLFVENSIVATNGRLLDLHVGRAAPDPAVVLRSATLSAADELLHLDAPGGPSAKPLRVFAEYTVFGPAVRLDGNAAARPALIGGLSGAAIGSQLAWWEYACGYHPSIRLPSPETGPADSGDALAAWERRAGPLHIDRSIMDAGAVLFPREFPQLKEVTQADFHLKRPEAKAASWTDVGTPIGATVATIAPSEPKPPVAERKARGNPPVKKGGPGF
jgi:hypothetical protein